MKKRNERETEKEKEKECKTERKKKERQKEEKDKEMWILYSYIVKDVVDEMKLSIHPSVASSILSSVPSSIQTEQIYILKREKTREKNHTLKKKGCLLFPNFKPASNQTKIKKVFKIIFIIKHINKTKFLKKGNRN